MFKSPVQMGYYKSVRHGAGFLIFLWALATLVICAALGVGVGLAAWTGGLWLWRRLHYWDRMVRAIQERHASFCLPTWDVRTRHTGH
jgi:hypothetical protein